MKLVCEEEKKKKKYDKSFFARGLNCSNSVHHND